MNTPTHSFFRTLTASGLCVAEEPYAKKWTDSLIWGGLALCGAVAIGSSTLLPGPYCDVENDTSTNKLAGEIEKFRDWLREAGGSLEDVHIGKSEVCALTSIDMG